MKALNIFLRGLLSALAPAATVVVMAISFHAHGPAAPFTFTSFDYPGAVATRAVGINKVGVITGDYIDAGGMFHGFARSPNGTFMQIDYPGAMNTSLYHINDLNQAVGFYSGPDDISHGFMFFPPNRFTSIDYPGASQTEAGGINDNGQIVGTWFNSLGSQSGFSLLNGTYTDLLYPNAVSTVASDVTAAGRISGNWGNTTQHNQSHGFLLTSAVGGTFGDVEFPGAARTLIYAIDDLNQAVGTYYTSSNVQHGWGGVPTSHLFMTIDYPGSTACSVSGISNNGHLAGDYTDTNGVVHGFLAVPLRQDQRAIPGHVSGSGE